MADNGKNKSVAKTAKKRNSLVQYFIDLKSEIKRLTWPSKNDVKKAIIAVLVFCAVYVAIITVFDFGFKHAYDLIFKANL